MKNNSGLQQAVLDLIKKIYCVEYNHRLEVFKMEGTDNEPTTYILHMYIHTQRNQPMVISYQCETDEEFLSFVERELKLRNLIRSDFYKIKLHGSH